MPTKKKSVRKLKHKPYLALKAALVARGLNQKYVAQLLKLSPVTVNQKINGTLEFTLTEAETIVNNLGIGLDIFLSAKVS